MSRTKVAFSSNYRGGDLGVHLCFDREVTEGDVRSCRRIFATALHAVFTDAGMRMNRIDFADGGKLPLSHSEYPFNVGGEASMMGTKISPDQHREFYELFMSLMAKTKRYTVTRQRRTVQLVHRSER